MKRCVLTILFTAAMIKAFAGAAEGPVSFQSSLKGNESDRFEIRFSAGETAQVTVTGNGKTDLDLYIYDDDGDPVTRDTGRGDRCICRWIPRKDGKFTIKVVNRGKNYNLYTLQTN